MQKINAANLLSIPRFWEIIDHTLIDDPTLDKQYESLISELHKLSEQEIFGFVYHFYKYCSQSYVSELWAVAYVVMGGCSDDGFDYFRHWLVTRGRDVYQAALRNPDSLSDEFDKIPEGDIPEFEDIAYAPKEVIEAKFGMDFYEEEEKYDFEEALKQPEISLEWALDNDSKTEEALRLICPQIFEKWWENDRF